MSEDEEEQYLAGGSPKAGFIHVLLPGAVQELQSPPKMCSWVS